MQSARIAAANWYAALGGRKENGWRYNAAAVSGEHRLPACWSRQLAETGGITRAFQMNGCKVLPAGCRQLRAGSPRSPESRGPCAARTVVHFLCLIRYVRKHSSPTTRISVNAHRTLSGKKLLLNPVSVGAFAPPNRYGAIVRLS